MGKRDFPISSDIYCTAESLVLVKVVQEMALLTCLDKGKVGYSLKCCRLLCCCALSYFIWGFLYYTFLIEFGVLRFPVLFTDVPKEPSFVYFGKYISTQMPFMIPLISMSLVCKSISIM